MPSTFTPKQIADMLQVSTTTLRKYEDLNLIPDVTRTKSNRRLYYPIHVQAFATIRALLKSYAVNIAYNIMRQVKQGQTEQALWLINEQQYKLQLEKMRVESIVNMLSASQLHTLQAQKLKEWMTIGEAADIAAVNSSAIRHWEKEGLIASQRNPDNGYRMFAAHQVQKILIISSLRKTIYSIENMKQLLRDFDHHRLADIEKSFQSAFHNLHYKLMRQHEAVVQLASYIHALEGTSPPLPPQA